MKDTTAAAATGAENIVWNLSDLVAPPADQGIETLLAEADRRLDAFAARYRGRIAGLASGEMSVMLTEYEALIDMVGRAESYASLSWSTQSDDPARGALLQKVAERQSQLVQKSVFLDIEWANVPDAPARRLIDDPALARWRHWMLMARRY